MFLFHTAERDVSGMIKKNGFVVFLVLLLISCFAFSSFASDTKLRGSYARLPKVIAELSGEYDEDDIDLAVLEGEKLKIESVKRGKDVSKLVYMLIDISISMSQSTLDTLKPSLRSYAQSRGGEDRRMLMT